MSIFQSAWADFFKKSVALRKNDANESPKKACSTLYLQVKATQVGYYVWSCGC